MVTLHVVRFPIFGVTDMQDFSGRFQSELFIILTSLNKKIFVKYI